MSVVTENPKRALFLKSIRQNTRRFYFTRKRLRNSSQITQLDAEKMVEYKISENLRDQREKNNSPQITQINAEKIRKKKNYLMLVGF